MRSAAWCPSARKRIGAGLTPLGLMQAASLYSWKVGIR
jgi:hypothetical protein